MAQFYLHIFRAKIRQIVFNSGIITDQLYREWDRGLKINAVSIQNYERKRFLQKSIK